METNNWIKEFYPGFLDYTIMGVYLILIFLTAYIHQQKSIAFNTSYRFFTKALSIKILGTIAFGLIYLLYYKGAGDTTGYFNGGKTLINMLFYEPAIYWKLLFNGATPELLSYFNIETGYPTFSRDSSAFMVNRITSIFVLFGFKSYFTASILFASFFFLGNWKLFLLFTKLYPQYDKHLAIAVLFFPSLVFWASGISKDTVSFAFTAWFTHAFYSLFIEKKDIIKKSILLIISGYFIIAIKPYIIVALLPGAIFWMGWEYLKKIHSPLFRFIVAPAASIILISASFLILNSLKENLGVYGDMDKIIDKAILTYEDHTRVHQYGENFYTLGEFDGTLGNFLGKAPQATNAGLFRPYLFEVRNVVMLLAAIENTILLLLVLIIFWRTGVVKGFKIIFDEPLVIFSLLFSIVFAFAVGVSTANFGALVRLKTPMLPFFGAALAILFNKSMEYKREKQKNT